MPGTNGHDEHPNLTEDEDKAQRGDNPPDSFGTSTDRAGRTSCPTC